MSHKIVASEVRKMGLIEYLKKYKSKMSKKQLFQIGRDYMEANYMLNGHTHVVVTNKVLEQFEDTGGDKNVEKVSGVRRDVRGKKKGSEVLQQTV